MWFSDVHDECSIPTQTILHHELNNLDAKHVHNYKINTTHSSYDMNCEHRTNLDVISHHVECRIYEVSNR